MRLTRSASSLAEVDVSIHAPVKGATRRAEAGRREQGVSIHAPVKGATRLGARVSEAVRCFNPRTREGCDGRDGPEDRQAGVSIHAPVKGATPLSIMDPSYDLLVSIHAPVKGATGVGRGSTTSLV